LGERERGYEEREREKGLKRGERRWMNSRAVEVAWGRRKGKEKKRKEI